MVTQRLVPRRVPVDDMDAFVRVDFYDLTLEEVGSLDNVKHLIDWLANRHWQ